MLEIINKNIHNVAGGLGGDTYLIVGRAGTAVIDAGMAYCGDKLVENIVEILGDKPLDFIILSHTHYDHVGGTMALRAKWPEVTVLSSEHGKKVLDKESSKILIKDLSISASKMFGQEIEQLDMEGLYVDEAIKDGDIIDLGNIQIEVFETKGHTKCCLAFFLRNEDVLFPGETPGVLLKFGEMSPVFLTSYKDTINSINKLRKLQAKYIISPHYGLIDPADSKNYWDWAQKACEECKKFVVKYYKEDYSKEEILVKFAKRFRSEASFELQPDEAFEINSARSIEVIIKEFF
jgi:2-aminobenzoylacetyl-CoA thioesterase